MKFIGLPLLIIFLTSCSSFSEFQNSVQGPYTVTGEGDNEAQAREDGFRQAVGLAMGIAVRSERVVKDNEVALNYVLTHSSGYVERSIINSVEKAGGRFRVGMDVFIKPTIVDDYVLYSAKSAQSIDCFRPYKTGPSALLIHRLFFSKQPWG